MKERERIFQKFGGRCAYCGGKLKKGWHEDHKEPIGRLRRYDHDKRKVVYEGVMRNPENDNFENKVPACPSCNINKHEMDIEQFRAAIKKYVESLNKRSTQYKMAKKFGLIQETGVEVEFYFEKCSK